MNIDGNNTPQYGPVTPADNSSYGPPKYEIKINEISETPTTLLSVDQNEISTYNLNNEY